MSQAGKLYSPTYLEANEHLISSVHACILRAWEEKKQGKPSKARCKVGGVGMVWGQPSPLPEAAAIIVLFAPMSTEEMMDGRI